ncbi:MAG: hydrogenase formation protein HypD [Candidatus Brocadiae bacterium]|nr:hydrogenase formation protein HypD [Candidatus Brocadiia bacterium]
MQEYDAFYDSKLAKELVASIHRLFSEKKNFLPKKITMMEVCGTHTMEIGRLGIRHLLPAEISLLSGPGCPVCVTPSSYIEEALELVKNSKNCLVTFGDLIHVPGKKVSLAFAKAQGCDIRVITSPLQILEMAKDEPSKEFIFTSIGFETTVPVTAKTVFMAHQKKLKNISFLVAHRVVPPVLQALIEDPDLSISGFLLPGHVSAVIGEDGYQILHEHCVPGVITGFAPVDILGGILSLLEMLTERPKACVKNMYTRFVSPHGNTKALELIHSIYEPCDAVLRGIGIVKLCGLKLRKNYESYDAQKKYGIEIQGEEMPVGCSCGQVLKGLIRPNECPLFKKACTPDHPVGPCMVSTEGSCAAYFRYGY